MTPEYFVKFASNWPYAVAMTMVAFPCYSIWRYFTLLAYDQTSFVSDPLIPWTFGAVLVTGWIVLIGVRRVQAAAQFREFITDHNKKTPWLTHHRIKASFYFLAYWVLVILILHFVVFEKQVSFG
jgi:type VI protein secretion system component VasK